VRAANSFSIGRAWAFAPAISPERARRAAGPGQSAISRSRAASRLDVPFLARDSLDGRFSFVLHRRKPRELSHIGAEAPSQH
jgi:hypothetical protein